MLKNYFKIAIRSLIKKKGYTFINLAGLSVGLGVCLIIALFLQFHLNFDRFHKHADRIYRIAVTQEQGDETIRSGNMPGPMAQALVNEIPGIEEAVRFNKKGKTLVTIDDKSFYDNEIIQTDPSFFRMFSFPLIHGNPESVLSVKNNAVLSQDVAHKYFGDQNPIGQEIILDEENSFIVTGIVEAPPEQSHLDFSMLVNIPDTLYGADVNSWNKLSAFYTYLLVSEKASPNKILSEIPSIQDNVLSETSLKESKFYLQPLGDIHLKSDLNFELIPQRIFSINYIYIFSIIGGFVLLIACVNYVNLATVRATSRLKEVGIRKAAGAQRSNLFWQFTGELLLLTFLAAVLAVGLAELLLPFVNNLMEIQLSSDAIWSLTFLTGFIVSVFLIGFISGIYPAIVLSSLKPSDIFRGSSSTPSSGGLRKVLVVFQFTISMILIISTMVIHGQLNHFQNLNLGLNPDQVLNISFESSGTQQIAPVFLEKLSQNSNILSITTSEGIPGKQGLKQFFYPEGHDNPPLIIGLNRVDQHFIETMEMELIAGRNFTALDANRKQKVTILNEATLKEMGWGSEDAIDKTIGTYRVIGVVKDFHYESFEKEISPAMMTPLGDFSPRYISARLNTTGISDMMNWIQNEWEQTAGSYPFQYHFMDDTFENLYRSEVRLGILFTGFSIITIFIACLGLFGLVAFMASKRTKEIGIRKVLGATVASIVGLLSKDFIKLVVTGFVIAIPIAWYAMNQWLAGFAYRIEIGVEIFAIAGTAAVAIAILTVSWQSIKAALMNPVESLRNE